jgi:hypothetical protein
MALNRSRSTQADGCRHDRVYWNLHALHKLVGFVQ